MNLHFTCDAYFEDAAGRSFEQTLLICAPDFSVAAQFVEQQIATAMRGSRIDELNLQTIRGELAGQEQQRSGDRLGVYFSSAPREIQGWGAEGFLQRFQRMNRGIIGSAAL